MFGRKPKNESPPLSQQLVYASESRPTSYSPSQNLHHHYSFDEAVIEYVQSYRELGCLIPLCTQTLDTNFQSNRTIEQQKARFKKAIKYAKLRMGREARRFHQPFLKGFEANILGRLENNRQGSKIKVLTTERKHFVTGEAKKGEL